MQLAAGGTPGAFIPVDALSQWDDTTLVRHR